MLTFLNTFNKKLGGRKRLPILEKTIKKNEFRKQFSGKKLRDRCYKFQTTVTLNIHSMNAECLQSKKKQKKRLILPRPLPLFSFAGELHKYIRNIFF